MNKTIEGPWKIEPNDPRCGLDRHITGPHESHTAAVIAIVPAWNGPGIRSTHGDWVTVNDDDARQIAALIKAAPALLKVALVLTGAAENCSMFTWHERTARALGIAREALKEMTEVL